MGFGFGFWSWVLDTAVSSKSNGSLAGEFYWLSDRLREVELIFGI